MTTVTLTRKEFEALPDYSCSLPTGTTIGKQWKKRKNYYDESKGWVRGTYSKQLEPDLVAITWENIWIASLWAK